MSPDCPWSDMRVDQLSVDQRIIAAVTRARFSSVPELLSVPALDLQRLSGLSRADVRVLLSAAAAACRPRGPLPALELRGPDAGLRLSLGCPVLDRLLRGGLPVGAVTELSGESAAGKTQLALQLCLSARLPVQYQGLDSGAVYVCSEDAFPAARLFQMMSEQARLRPHVPPPLLAALRFSDHIYVEHAADLDSLQACLERRAPLLLARGAARLLVLDSAAALFRCQFQADDWLEKNRRLRWLGAKLQRLASDFNAVVLVINQVTDVFNSSHRTGPTESPVVPALGLSWSNHILTRLMMRRLQASVDSGDQRAAVRLLTVEFAPHLSRGGQEAAVWREGVRGLTGPRHQEET